MANTRHFDELLRAEGWDIVEDRGVPWVIAMGEKIGYAHPFSVYGKLSRSTGNPEIRYQCLRAMHRFAWPDYEPPGTTGMSAGFALTAKAILISRMPGEARPANPTSPAGWGSFSL